MVIDGTHIINIGFTSLLLRPAVLLAHGTGAQAPSMPTYGPCYRECHNSGSRARFWLIFGPKD